MLFHWGRVTHICDNKLTSFGSDNGLAPGRRQSIIWTKAVILLIRTLRTILNEISIEIHIFPFTKMHLKMSSGKWRPFCLGLNVLKRVLDVCILLTYRLVVWLGVDKRDLYCITVSHVCLIREGGTCVTTMALMVFNFKDVIAIKTRLFLNEESD